MINVNTTPEQVEENTHELAELKEEVRDLKSSKQLEENTHNLAELKKELEVLKKARSREITPVQSPRDTGGPLKLPLPPSRHEEVRYDLDLFVLLNPDTKSE